MCALVRMKPNVTRKETKNRNSGWRPVSTIARSYTLPMLARTGTSTREQGSGASGRRLGDQHDLADVAALLDHAVRFRGAVEGERLGHHRLQVALRETFDKRVHNPPEVALAVPPVEHVEPEDALVLVHDPEALPPRHRRQRHPDEASQGGRDVALAA